MFLQVKIFYLSTACPTTGISRSTLGTYETNDTREIGSEKLRILAQYYPVSSDYLLGSTDNTQAIDADLSELKLDDGIINILKSGGFSHRLLFEIIKHSGLKKLLANMEIYIDGIVTSQIHTPNSIADFAR